MQTESIMMEGRNCPVQQRILTVRSEMIMHAAWKRYEQAIKEKNAILERRANEAAFLDLSEQGLAAF